MQQINWDDLRVFYAIAQGRSVRGAAALLGLHHSTIARRLDQLEQCLGVLLFTRTPRGLQLTVEGHTLLAGTERVGREVEEIQRQVGGRDQALAGRIRVTLPDAMAVSFLMDAFARFGRTYTEIDLEFLPSYTSLDIGRREADLAIRATKTPPQYLIGRPLGRFSVAIYASQAYLQAHDPEDHPELCSWVDWVNVEQRMQQIKNSCFPAIPVKTRCDNLLLQLSAVAAGVGLAVLPCALGDTQPGLVRLDAVEPVEVQDIWLLTHPDLRHTARIQALMGAIVDAFSANRDLLLGRRPGNAAAAA